MLAGIEGITGGGGKAPGAMQVSSLAVKVDGNRPVDGNPSVGSFPASFSAENVMTAQAELGQMSAAVDFAKEIASIRAKQRGKAKELHGIILSDKENEMQTALGMTQRQAAHGQATQRFSFAVGLEEAFNGGYMDPMTNEYSMLAA